MLKKSSSKRKLREFGFLIGFGFPIIIGWIIPIIAGHGFKIWTLWVGLIGLILGIISPVLLNYPYKAWMAIGHALGWINSRIILGLVFIIVLQPIALTMSLFKYDPLRKRKNQKISYRECCQNRKVNFTKIF